MLSIRYDQTEFGLMGNCAQAAIATLLGVENLSDVPNFIEGENGERQSPTLFWESIDDYLLSQGYVRLMMGNNFRPECTFIASGKSVRDLMHMVIMYDNKLLHDPHPSRNGIVSVDYVHMVVPIDASSFVRKKT